jgi:hypothetical protein
VFKWCKTLAFTASADTTAMIWDVSVLERLQKLQANKAK